MTSSFKKCFCPLYEACEANPETKISTGPGMEKSGADFVKLANLICIGTTVYVHQEHITSENLNSVTGKLELPEEAYSLQCEYFNSSNKF